MFLRTISRYEVDKLKIDAIVMRRSGMSLLNISFFVFLGYDKSLDNSMKSEILLPCNSYVVEGNL